MEMDWNPKMFIGKRYLELGLKSSPHPKSLDPGSPPHCPRSPPEASVSPEAELGYAKISELIGVSQFDQSEVI